MKTYALVFATALSFFASAPSSADVLWQFDGVCTIATWDLDHIGIPCSTISDPSVRATVLLGDDGLVKEFNYIDFVTGSPSSIEGLTNPDSFGTIPAGITVLIGDDGNFHTTGGLFGFTTEMTFGFVHQTEGSGVWTRVPEPSTLALLAFGFIGVAATRRRRLHPV